ncbi:MAG: hypothetical protein QM636_14545 [Rhizobium sp.]
MLDIYYANPSVTVMPEDPGKLEFAGSIDVDAHRALASFLDQSSEAKIRLTYFEDSLLMPAQVATLLEILIANTHDLERNGQAFAAFDLMRGILEAAVNRGMGLVAFSD